MPRCATRVAATLGVGLLALARPVQGQDAGSAVAAAVLPLPPELQAGATVVRLTRDGEVDTLRAGSNPMVCFADNPSDTLLDVRFMRRSRRSRRWGWGMRRTGSSRT